MKRKTISQLCLVGRIKTRCNSENHWIESFTLPIRRIIVTLGEVYPESDIVGDGFIIYNVLSFYIIFMRYLKFCADLCLIMDYKGQLKNWSSTAKYPNKKDYTT